MLLRVTIAISLLAAVLAPSACSTVCGEQVEPDSSVEFILDDQMDPQQPEYFSAITPVGSETKIDDLKVVVNSGEGKTRKEGVNDSPAIEPDSVAPSPCGCVKVDHETEKVAAALTDSDLQQDSSTNETTQRVVRRSGKKFRVVTILVPVDSSAPIVGGDSATIPSETPVVNKTKDLEKQVEDLNAGAADESKGENSVEIKKDESAEEEVSKPSAKVEKFKKSKQVDESKKDKKRSKRSSKEKSSSLGKSKKNSKQDKNSFKKTKRNKK